jgi:hypothetical protein
MQMPEQGDAQKKLAEAMGPELWTLFNVLDRDVVWLHMKWKQYRLLFAHSAERIALLNSKAEVFFGFLQRTLLEDTVLHIARLFDKPIVCGKETGSLRSFEGRIVDHRISEIAQQKIEEARSLCAPMTDWRNRRLAHSELAILTATNDEPLLGISRTAIECSLTAISGVMNCLSQHYAGVEIAYRACITRPGDAESLIYWLQAGSH